MRRMKFFTRSKKQKGWLVIDESPEEIDCVHAEVAPGARASIDLWTSFKTGPAPGALEKIARDRHFERYQCATLLKPGEYQLLMVDAPPVPPAELKSALRWRIKDMLDYHVDDATLDVMDIPPVGGQGGRGHSLFAVAAKNEVIGQRIKRFEAARIPLEVIDIPETAQRNIAALHEAEKRGTALLFLESRAALLTINYAGELYLARRLDVGLEQISRQPPGERKEVFERILVELQRTFDHFDRQHAVTVAKILLGPEPEPTGLEDFLRANLDIAVEGVNLAERLSVSPARGFDPAMQWRLFHLVGAALRHEDRVII